MSYWINCLRNWMGLLSPPTNTGLEIYTAQITDATNEWNQMALKRVEERRDIQWSRFDSDEDYQNNYSIVNVSDFTDKWNRLALHKARKKRNIAHLQA